MPGLPVEWPRLVYNSPDTRMMRVIGKSRPPTQDGEKGRVSCRERRGNLRRGKKSDAGFSASPSNTRRLHRRREPRTWGISLCLPPPTPPYVAPATSKNPPLIR
uniref:Uncharacterized protein n=1 Tax=Anatid alphaherpesvirus 2 TaxID=3080522 RepID=A0AAU0K6G2_9ALPH